MAEAAEIGLQQKRQEQQRQQNYSDREHRNQAYKDQMHNRQADNQRTDDNLERNKYNSVPRSRQDYSPKPAPKTVNERAREFFRDKTVPARKWEKARKPGGLKPKHTMSQEERDWHYAQGLCLNCHESGHKARDCPKRQVVSGNGNNPPGRSNLGRANTNPRNRQPVASSSAITLESSRIGVNISDLDKRSRLADSTQNQTNLRMNAINLVLADDRPTSFDDRIPDLQDVSHTEAEEDDYESEDVASEYFTAADADGDMDEDDWFGVPHQEIWHEELINRELAELADFHDELGTYYNSESEKNDLPDLWNVSDPAWDDGESLPELNEVSDSECDSNDDTKDVIGIPVVEKDGNPHKDEIDVCSVHNTYEQIWNECQRTIMDAMPTYVRSDVGCSGLEHATSWNNSSLGDIIADDCVRQLAEKSIFPGDEALDPDDETRFHVYLTQNGYVIMDMWRMGDLWRREDPVVPLWVILDGRVTELYSTYCVGQDVPVWYGCANSVDVLIAIKVDTLLNAPFEDGRFCVKIDTFNQELCIVDTLLESCLVTAVRTFLNPRLRLFDWYKKRVERSNRRIVHIECWRANAELNNDDVSCLLDRGEAGESIHLVLGAINPEDQKSDRLVGLQRNAAMTKDFDRLVLKPIVIVVKINGMACQALLDSGSLSDFVSTSLLDQLRLERVSLEKPIQLQLAVQGSRSKVNFGTSAQFEYQTINEIRYFDVANLSNYDLILGTPFLFQHQVLIGFNAARVIIGSNESLPIEGENVSKLSARTVELVDEDLDQVRNELMDYADSLGLFKDPSLEPLPPFCVINHEIPLINENLVYPWRPSRCPEKFREQMD